MRADARAQTIGGAVLGGSRSDGRADGAGASAVTRGRAAGAGTARAARTGAAGTTASETPAQLPTQWQPAGLACS